MHDTLTNHRFQNPSLSGLELTVKSVKDHHLGCDSKVGTLPLLLSWAEGPDPFSLHVAPSVS